MNLSDTATRTALFSSYAKPPELKEFAKTLYFQGWNIVASGGTALFLREVEEIQVTDVATMVGPPILGHKVVTLSREVHAAILADLTNPEEVEELERLKINPINLVYVDLYPLQQEISKEGATFDSVIKMTDIGGPTMLRAAAKGGRIVLVSPAQFPDTLHHLNKVRDNELTGVQRRSFLSTLAADAERLVMDYCSASCIFHKKVAHTGQFP
ncbi:hypothetical protein A2419_01635 [Candidatus Adlerbacteria bacterium RIFOXYC1_FULL_48_26]|uniref:MGS-like domain-containing protein n=1 Tax=Candidatus Adlerbacteria bacterium RIFOXYC1_FULL_48_26 TaxID=1797247 RepID=A0A1F4Y383_9BACT|nr:MAG: hypothetical protein A2419_01635 [Candidatus Adlerbacteria bacterium RIFOXYC1_FULL_48_26]OGC93410.1 MAG: hypothetical protein A2389_02585 [Candidatus Adlerbacteria bacterium RIFOXYB1_FULL_48_10]OGC95955.1 MAG: hypothetical protein A2590_00130 [Candidatus Adlerbacteria bacterium RIFOXYD1_FULL_48_8]